MKTHNPLLFQNNMDIKYPQFINIDKKVKEKYLKPLIDKNSSTVFAKKEQTDVYFIACALGFKNGIRKPSKKPSENVRLYESLSDDLKMFIRAVAIADSNYDIDVIFDGKKTLDIVEEYVNGGLPILSELVFNSTDLSIEDDLEEIFNLFVKKD